MGNFEGCCCGGEREERRVMVWEEANLRWSCGREENMPGEGSMEAGGGGGDKRKVVWRRKKLGLFYLWAVILVWAGYFGLAIWSMDLVWALLLYGSGSLVLIQTVTARFGLLCLGFMEEQIKVVWDHQDGASNLSGERADQLSLGLGSSLATQSFSWSLKGWGNRVWRGCHGLAMAIS